MKSDSEIARDVEDDLRGDPDISSDDIAVAVNNGAVALTGFARSYVEKRVAEVDAKYVAGWWRSPTTLRSA
jgi:osmotically-inducible protein OsmY